MLHIKQGEFWLEFISNYEFTAGFSNNGKKMLTENRRQLLIGLQEYFNQEKRSQFRFLGKGGHYTKEQKEYVFAQIEDIGIRATAKILMFPRRTLQRWCKKHYVFVKPYPDWVIPWAERRRKRREFWARRGY